MCVLRLEKQAPLVLTLEEAAEKLQVSKQTIKECIRKREIVGFRVGRSWRVRASSLSLESLRVVKPGSE